MPKITIKINGQEVIKEKLSKYEREIRKALRRGVAKGSSIINKDAKAQWRQRSGLLKKAQGFVVRTYKGGRTIGVIGPRKGYRTTINEINGKKIVASRIVTITGGKANRKEIKLKAFEKAAVGQILDPIRYAHFVEKGHAKGKGKSAAKAYPALAIAERRNRKAAQAAIADAVREVKP